MVLKIMYAELLKHFENVENLGGKAWQHAMNVDSIDQMNIKDILIHYMSTLTG